MKIQLLNQQPVFKALQDQAVKVPHLAELFQQNPHRAQQMSIESAGICLDYSKQRVTDQVLSELEQLFYQVKLPQSIAELFSGAVVNQSENRAALHTQLRLPAAQQPEAFAVIEQALLQMEALVDQVQQGVWRGFSGKRITDVVNLGVGGSDLGPLMVTQALKEYAEPQAKALKVHFASTIDGSQLFDLLDHLNPETTLFLIASKSFTTIDTLSNADTVRAWLAKACPSETLMLRCHFVGISASADKMQQWGIAPENQLPFWSWVGGRFSLWSTVGCAIALDLGMGVFRQLLAGAYAMDEHFRTAPPLQNIPVMMALLGVWNVNVLDIRAHAILPYDGRLKYFPSYLEQLEMESNGKSVTQSGEPINYATCPVLWGEIGANAQHAFYQLLHQGTQAVAADFILAANRYEASQSEAHYEALIAQHELNIANCLAQSRVLALGNAAVEPSDNPFRHYPGNQPSSTLLLDRLDASTLGGLIACYEHKVFTQAVIWGINPFDQWGVELGKQVALQLQAVLAGKGDTELDSSTLHLAAQINSKRGRV
ncbi:glucose-6-phosphate isomerase [Oceanospirillum multiglobuliferum]|uniref:Glucose-6-phosphate isomerase n=1 Tax=Oceanospirillum multiglobuliferum TaxID=64969 RepID=A0A1T4S8X8_9GAMM|nr:glucose-6-phosphate isomerase [Oceanospirillum multiglobuliferum]OPX54377.1 glucose-6-phosphate isomerase [Oceanospirillum multiglobuliferum]SKA24675.1 glucose-6-phosphate isomerase [Oceanospirillum multiglobuliferum]